MRRGKLFPPHLNSFLALEKKAHFGGEIVPLSFSVATAAVSHHIA